MLNPLALANQKLTEARDSSKAHLASIRYARAEMEKTGFQFAPTDSVAEVAAAGAAWESKKTALRSAELNFNPATYVMDKLDNSPSSKTILEAAFQFLQARHRDFVKGTKSSLLSKVADAFKPAQNAQDEPPKREPPRGVWGADEPAPVEIELAAISKQVGLFPEGKSYAGVLAMMNAANSRLELPEAKPKQAQRQDKPFIVREHPSPLQPNNAYTNPSFSRPISQPEPSRPMRVIVGA